MIIHLRTSILLFFCALFVFSALPPEIPESPKGLIYIPCDYANWGQDLQLFYKPIKAILEAHGYVTDVLCGEVVGHPENPTIDDYFVKAFNSPRGYITIFTHGEAGWLALEYYKTRAEAENREQQLENIYGAGFFDVFKDPAHDPPYYYMIAVNSSFIQQQIVNPLPASLIFVDACNSASGSPSILQAFLNTGAHCGFGWSAVVGGSEIFAPIDIFYRMGGSNYLSSHPMIPHVLQYDLYNKTAATARSEYGNPRLVLKGNANMVLYNAPRIVGLEVRQAGTVVYRYGFDEDGLPPKYPYRWEYPGDLSGCPKNPAVVGNQPLEFQILFSSPMNPTQEPPRNIKVYVTAGQGNFAIPVTGNWAKSIFDNDWWSGACDFSEWSDKALPISNSFSARIFENSGIDSGCSFDIILMLEDEGMRC